VGTGGNSLLPLLPIGSPRQCRGMWHRHRAPSNRWNIGLPPRSRYGNIARGPCLVAQAISPITETQLPGASFR
jgi:hypothetical protein